MKAIRTRISQSDDLAAPVARVVLRVCDERGLDPRGAISESRGRT